VIVDNVATVKVVPCYLASRHVPSAVPKVTSARIVERVSLRERGEIAMTDPVEMRRSLSLELRRLRNSAGLTQRQVVERMDWSTTKIIRIEKGTVGVSINDLRALLAYYGVVSDEVSSRLEHLARNSKRLPFEQYKRLFADNTVHFYQQERTSAKIRAFQPLVVPGLLQIEPYIRALQVAYGASREHIDGIIDSRLERQEVLERADLSMPYCVFLLDESVLWRPVGGADVMLKQLAHLIEVNERPGVEIRIIPQETGAYPGLLGSYVHLEFDDGPMSRPDAVYIENQIGESLHHDDSAVIERCLEQFTEMESMATEKHELRDRLTSMLHSNSGWTRHLDVEAPWINS
jgi:transcriptional regulator with XRE-family HTH domain